MVAGGLEPDLVREGAPVGVAVHRDDPVAAQRGQGRAEADGRRGLADAALEAEHGDPVMAAGDRGPDPADQVAAAHARGRLADADEPAGRRGTPSAASRRPVAARLPGSSRSDVSASEVGRCASLPGAAGEPRARPRRLAARQLAARRPAAVACAGSDGGAASSSPAASWSAAARTCDHGTDGAVQRRRGGGLARRRVRVGRPDRFRCLGRLAASARCGARGAAGDTRRRTVPRRRRLRRRCPGERPDRGRPVRRARPRSSGRAAASGGPAARRIRGAGGAAGAARVLARRRRHLRVAGVGSASESGNCSMTGRSGSVSSGPPGVTGANG